jgi:hypothetical protein
MGFAAAACTAIAMAGTFRAPDSSSKPQPIVLAAIHVARATAAMRPYPAERDSAAANERRRRSPRCATIAAKRSRMTVVLIIPTRYESAP